MNLTELANKYGTDKGDKNYEAHNYTPIYESFIFRDKPVTLLEIGVNDPRFPGASLYMWAEYLHPKSRIYGLDITPPNIPLPDNVTVVYADQSNLFSLFKAINLIGEPSFDYITDDGFHSFEHQIVSFIELFQMIKPGGTYFIEDCHARDCGNTVKFFKNMSESTADLFGIETIGFETNDKLIVIQKK